MAGQSRGQDATFLLTRPKAQSDRFAASLVARFGPLPILIAPLMDTRFLAPTLPLQNPAGVIFTSEAGVVGYARLAAGAPPPAWCVGRRTAERATEAGFAVAGMGVDAQNLSSILLASGIAGPLIHARGRHVSGTLADDLSRAGIHVRECVVYEQAEQELSASGRAALARTAPILLPLFSPRSAALAARACAERRARLSVAALSPAVAVAAHPLAPERIEVAERPDEAALLDAVALMLGEGSVP